MINAPPPQIQTPQAKIRKEHSHPLFLSHIQNIHKTVRNRGLKCPANSMHVSISALLLIQALASTTKAPAGLPASHLVHLYSVLHKADRDLSRNANQSVLLCRELPVAFFPHLRFNLSCVQVSLKSWLARLLSLTSSHTFSGSLLLNLARLLLFCYWRVIIIFCMWSVFFCCFLPCITVFHRDPQDWHKHLNLWQQSWVQRAIL